MPSLVAEQSPAELGRAVALFAAAFSVAYYAVGRPIYYLFFHPLRQYPGPKLWAISQIPLALSNTSGNHHKDILALHKKFGDIVRVSPTELSFVQPEAWKAVQGHRRNGQTENGKDWRVYGRIPDAIISAPRETHGHIRRVVSHGFSAKRMVEQQPLIAKHIDLFFDRMRARASQGEAVDIVAWYNYTTFDIIGDLAFGEPFGCLEQSGMHHWVATIFQRLREGNALISLRKIFGDIDSLLMTLYPPGLRLTLEHEGFARAKVDKRLAAGTQRPDFIDSMANRPKGDSLTKKQITQTADVLILAGSETTATVLSFVTHLLCKHPAIMAKVRAEVDDHFTREADIDFTSVQALKYMLAVLDETMRLFPAVPSALARTVPAEGTQLFGTYIPGGVALGIHQWPAYHYPGNFAKPDEFCPERWLGDPEFANDHREIFQPFSHGPRDCIGKNLAYAEMRTILARMLFNFDMALENRSREWLADLKTFQLWDKPAMYVKLTPRQRGAEA
ncbi:cytochrome P450 [Microdochium bolleyi]|uniref:Cytochrome P450 n=1 Tax=Microdochium bolleyi TaxID=196109 RepID=A0A136ILD2_9PEZI|nr:cytochrome P450 [Microdochium bolleyi]